VFAVRTQLGIWGQGWFLYLIMGAIGVLSAGNAHWVDFAFKHEDWNSSEVRCTHSTKIITLPHHPCSFFLKMSLNLLDHTVWHYSVAPTGYTKAFRQSGVNPSIPSANLGTGLGVLTSIWCQWRSCLRSGWRVAQETGISLIRSLLH
jgi:hypothetical protein